MPSGNTTQLAKRPRKFFRWAVISVVFLLGLPLLMSVTGLLPWSPVNCWHYDVDISSGRVRYIRYFAFVPVVKRIDESSLSRVLQPDDKPTAPPDWRRSLTLSPNVHHSPHYAYHSSMSQIKELGMIWEFGDFSPDARRLSAKQVLKLWQQSNGDDSAKGYLQALTDTAARLNSDNKKVGAADLPATW